jgi:isoamylase
MKIRPGSPYPLGATWDGAGVNFALFSENTTAVALCLFDSPDATTETRCAQRKGRLLLEDGSAWAGNLF